MTRSADERIGDILEAVDRCLQYRAHLGGEDPQVASMAYDAVLRNLAVVGEAARALPPEERDAHPSVPWASITGLRNVIVHECFRVRPDLVMDIIDAELLPLTDALRLRRRQGTLPD